MDGKFCPICQGSIQKPLFKVPFPKPSSTGKTGFHLTDFIDVPALTFVRCEICSVQFASPLPSKETVYSYYNSQLEPNDWEKEHYVEMNNQSVEGWDRFAKHITELNSKPGRLLEVGCAAGWLLKVARDRGWDVTGIEASPKFQNYATKQLKLSVKLGTIEEAELSEIGLFDVIVMTDVIEHLQDPIASLRKLREFIKPSGYLIIATCNIGSLYARLYGLKWRQIVISHLFYWTKHSMKVALNNSWFTVEHFSEPRYWSPNRNEERIFIIREIMKLIARLILLKTYIPLSSRLPEITRLVSRITNNKLSHKDILYKVGDQAALGDVMLVIARPTV